MNGGRVGQQPVLSERIDIGPSVLVSDFPRGGEQALGRSLQGGEAHQQVGAGRSVERDGGAGTPLEKGVYGERVTCLLEVASHGVPTFAGVVGVSKAREH